VQEVLRGQRGRRGKARHARDTRCGREGTQDAGAPQGTARMRSAAGRSRAAEAQTKPRGNGRTIPAKGPWPD